MDTADLTIYKGASFSVTPTLTSGSGVPMNLSGCGVSGYIKARYGNTGKLASFDITSIQTGSGIVGLALSSAVTSQLPVGYSFYDIEVYQTGTQITFRPLAGKVVIYPEVTY